MLSDEQRYTFDLKGYLVFPGILDHDLIHALRDHVNHGGTAFDGPAQELLDHPVVVDLLREIIAPDLTDNAYGFRCETGFIAHNRKVASPSIKPHRGPDFPTTRYLVEAGKIYSGFTRIGWELYDVNEEDHGTIFIPGSHKQNFKIPASLLDIDSPMWESYTCPAGSMIVFCEGLYHTGGIWNNTQNDRHAILYGYNHFSCQFHRSKSTMNHEVVESMPIKRQSLFRGVWWFANDSNTETRINETYSLENRMA